MFIYCLTFLRKLFGLTSKKDTPIFTSNVLSTPMLSNTESPVVEEIAPQLQPQVEPAGIEAIPDPMNITPFLEPVLPTVVQERELETTPISLDEVVPVESVDSPISVVEEHESPEVEFVEVLETQPAFPKIEEMD